MDQEDKKEQKQEILFDLLIRAGSDGSVIMTSSNNNLWVIRGILAKALHQICAMDIKQEDMENVNHCNNTVM
jgi:hypothetical protein